MNKKIVKQRTTKTYRLFDIKPLISLNKIARDIHEISVPHAQYTAH